MVGASLEIIDTKEYKTIQKPKHDCENDDSLSMLLYTWATVFVFNEPRSVLIKINRTHPQIDLAHENAHS